ncbi:VWA domain-containing protein, partial [Thiolapillus sp.]
MNWQDFHFIRPWWLLALLPVALGLARLWWRQGRDSAWSGVVSPELLPHLLLDEESRLSRWPLLLVFAGFLLAILAVAGPTWERLPQPVFSNQSPLVIALDLSRSMDARDVRPSRLQAARFKVEDILNRRKEGQTALIVFAGAPFTVSPLTDDAKTIISQLPALTTDIMPVQGSNTAAAIRQAVELLQQAQQHSGQILLITDGVNPAASVEAARKAADAGYQVSVLGVGTREGAPIPTGRGVIKDGKGKIVVARLNTESLEEVARAGKGRFTAMTLDDGDIRSLGVEDVKQGLTDAGDAADQEIARWRDYGPWLLLAVLPLAALAFRRGILLLAFVMVMPLPGKVEADWWSDLWYRPDQQGQQLMQQEQPQQAAQAFRNPDWKASALYRAGDYEQAEKLWAGEKDAESRYNLGNALAREGKLEQAIKAYDEALKQNPELADARANRDLLKKLLEQQKQKQQQNQQNQQ